MDSYMKIAKEIWSATYETTHILNKILHKQLLEGNINCALLTLRAKCTCNQLIKGINHQVKML